MEDVLIPPSLVELVRTSYNKSESEKKARLYTKEDIEDIRRNVINPYRGTIVENGKVTSFEDLVEVKQNEINKLGVMLEDEKLRTEAWQLLWDITISKEPGLDISRYSYQVMTNAQEIGCEELQIIDKAIVESQDCRELAYGVILHNIFYKRHDESKVRERIAKLRKDLPDISEFNTGYLESIAWNQSHEYGEYAGWARLHILRRLTEKVDRPIGTPFQEVLQEVFEETNRKLEIVRQMTDKDQGEVSLGLEVQGIVPKSVPGRTQERMRYTYFSPIDYRRMENVGGFISSYDIYYEFAFPPSFYPVDSILVLHELFDLGMVNWKEGITSMQITLGNLETSYDKREPAAIQILLLAAGYSFSEEELSPADRKVSWNLWPNKRFMHSRTNEEMMGKRNEEAPEVGSEMRITVLGTPWESYRMIIMAKQLGELAYKSQNFTSGVWVELLTEAKQVFGRYGLVSPSDLWTTGDLQDLRDVLKSDEKEKFCGEVKGLLKKYTSKDFETTASIANKDNNEQLSRKISGLIDKTIVRYGKTLNEAESKLLEKLGISDKDRQYAIKELTKLILTFTVSNAAIGELVNQIGGNPESFPQLLLTIGLGYGLARTLSTPDYVASIGEDIFRSIKQGKLLLGEHIKTEMFLLKMVAFKLYLEKFIGSLVTGNTTEVNESLACLGLFWGLMITDKLIKKRFAIEEYETK